MNALAAIHVARKQLGLDEDTYRAVLVRVTGKESTRAMSERERVAVVSELRKQGFRPALNGLQGPFAKKLQALWIAAWNLGIVRDKTDGAMLAFVKRQTGIDHTRFLLDGEDAARAIDALKGWMAREAGVDWSIRVGMATVQRMPGFKVAMAQWAILAKVGQVETGFDAFRRFAEERTFNPLPQMTAKEWAALMNTLGQRVRKAVR